MELSARISSGVWPAIVSYTDDLPDDVGGRATLMLIRIRPKYRGDEGIHRHELEHMKQFYLAWAAWSIACAVLLTAAGWGYQLLPALAVAGLGAHNALYRYSHRYRAWAEAAAYAVQTRHPDGKGRRLPLADAASRLSGPHYRLDISPAQAREMIADHL